MTPPALWIKDPLAILAEGAARGVVVQDGRIVELVAAGGVPATPGAAVFEAGTHVVLPGLINTHHHFYQTLTRATPAALDRTLFGWLRALYPIWVRLTPEALETAATVAMAELLLSGCTTTTDHHYVFPAGLESAIDIDIEVAVARRLGIRAVLTRGSSSGIIMASNASAIATRCAGRPRDRRRASAGRSWAGSRPAWRRIWRCSGSTSCASPARATRSPPWCCAARIGPTG